MPKTKSKVKKTVIKQEIINDQSLMQKLQEQLKLDQSYLSLILGLIIVLIAGILVFNYFKTSRPTLGPADQTNETAEADVLPENLPGKYTVKEGDTLFLIAQKYYNDGYKFTEIAKTNNLANENSIETGQILEIPKLDITVAEASPTPTITSEAAKTEELGTGGAENQTIWGEKISGDTYTVVAGDWLSTISGRAYGDIMQYTKIAEANKIVNPDVIEPGTVLKIPR